MCTIILGAPIHMRLRSMGSLRMIDHFSALASRSAAMAPTASSISQCTSASLTSPLPCVSMKNCFASSTRPFAMSQRGDSGYVTAASAGAAQAQQHGTHHELNGYKHVDCERDVEGVRYSPCLGPHVQLRHQPHWRRRCTHVASPPKLHPNTTKEHTTEPSVQFEFCRSDLVSRGSSQRPPHHSRTAQQ